MIWWQRKQVHAEINALFFVLLGLADTEGDDEKNIPILKEYITSVGTRLGITAFLMVFKIDSGVDMIITILTTFNEIMADFPNFWDNVVLVFTGCDYRRNVMNTKQLYHEAIQQQLQEHFFKDLYNSNNNSNNNNSTGGSGEDVPVVPMVFLTTAESPVGSPWARSATVKPGQRF
ncbi:MAG: hypothetical protein BYD32DRAFT_184929 [Podila humilis]|nr:MAG: hypothetical protein BYD32DRAFT_184929 [Podila humilis]